MNLCAKRPFSLTARFTTAFRATTMILSLSAILNCAEKSTPPPDSSAPIPATALCSFSEGYLPWPNDFALTDGYEDGFGDVSERWPAFQEFFTTYAESLPGATRHPLIRFLIDKPPTALAPNTFDEALFLLRVSNESGENTVVEAGPPISLIFEPWTSPSGETWTRFLGIPTSPLLQGQSYLVLLLSTATKSEGKPLVPSSDFAHIINEPEGNAPPDPRREQAAGDDFSYKREMKASIAPLLQWIKTSSAMGEAIPPGDPVLAWRFTVHNLPMAVCDPRDPSTPTPNILQRDQNGSLKAAFRRATISPADADHQAWASQLNGASVREKPQVGFSAVLSEDFIAKNHIHIFERDQADSDVTSWRAFSFSSEVSLTEPTLTIMPNGSPSRGHRGFNPGKNYLAVITEDSTTPAFAPSANFAMLRLEHPLIENGKSQLPQLSDAEAATMEQHRLGIQPILSGLKFHDVPPESVAALWSWQTRSDLELLYDLTSLRVPFPHDYLNDMDDAETSPPTDNRVDEHPKIDEAFISVGGFATTAPVHLAFTGPIEPESFDLAKDLTNLGEMSKAGLLIFDISELNAPSDFTKHICPDNLEACAPPVHVEAVQEHPGVVALKSKDNLPFPPGKRLLFVATRHCKSQDGSAPLGMDPRFHLLTLEHPLFDHETQQSLIQGLSDLEAANLEPKRMETTLLLGFINVATQGVIGPEDVLGLWTFQAGNPSEKISSLISAVYADPSLITAMEPLLLSSPEAIEALLPGTSLQHISGGVLEGQFFSRNRIDLANRDDALDAQDFNQWELVQRDFLMSLPKSAPPTHGWPIVIFQHNLGGSRFDLFDYADIYGEIGYAGIAIDASMHGDRRTEPGQEKLFLSDSIVPTYSPVLQSAVDLSALTRFIRESLPNNITVDIDKIYVHAESGGGIIATPFLALDPNISGGILSFFGGNIPHIVTENILDDSWANILEAWDWLTEPPSETNIPVARYLKLWELESIEPMIYAPMILSGTEQNPRSRRLLLQMLQPDPIIPALSTLELWKAAKGPENPLSAQLREYEDLCREFLHESCATTDAETTLEKRATAITDIQEFLEGTAP